KKGESTAFVLNFLPGQQLPAHKHPGSEVFLYVICGNGTFTIDGNEKAVEQFDLFHCSGEEELTFVNNGESPLSLYVVLSKIPSELYSKNI
ncbi:MAG: cupin domain-containing protein, partial [Bacillota bacterium]|nr:cupin domain-containing protein [Bacillota bacterium]